MKRLKKHSIVIFCLVCALTVLVACTKQEAYTEDIPNNSMTRVPITWKPSEGYAIVGERVEDYGVQTNIWNSNSQYSGIPKIIKDKKYEDLDRNLYSPYSFCDSGRFG